MFKLIPILLFVFTSTLVGQANLLLQKADSLYKAEDYLSSAKVYKEYINTAEVNDPWIYYNMACSWALANEDNNAFMALNSAAELGFKNGDHARRDKDLMSLRKKNEWGKTLQLFDKNLESYNAQFNLPLLKQMEEMYHQDQTLRQLYFDAQNKFGVGTREFNTFTALISQQDSLNQLKLNNILSVHGWLGRSEVGGKANMAQFLIIQHADSLLQLKALPLLRESVSKGESAKRHLAYLEDRVRLNQNKPQRYGTQSLWDDSLQAYKLYTLEDSSMVNTWRNDMGLPPLKGLKNE